MLGQTHLEWGASRLLCMPACAWTYNTSPQLLSALEAICISQYISPLKNKGYEMYHLL
jgi:hypothetical protein